MENKGMTGESLMVLGVLVIVMVVSGVVAVMPASTSLESDSEIAMGFWGWGTQKSCPDSEGTVPCTPERNICKEIGGKACEWKCGPGGTWGPGAQCGSAMCYGGRCHQPASP